MLDYLIEINTTKEKESGGVEVREEKEKHVFSCLVTASGLFIYYVLY